MTNLSHNDIRTPPWHPISNPVDIKHLGKLNEELGEAISAVSRCIIQGLEGVNAKSNQTNKEWLEDELADVIANSELVIDRFGLDKARIAQRVADKKAFLLPLHLRAR